MLSCRSIITASRFLNEIVHSSSCQLNVVAFKANVTKIVYLSEYMLMQIPKSVLWSAEFWAYCFLFLAIPSVLVLMAHRETKTTFPESCTSVWVYVCSCIMRMARAHRAKNKSWRNYNQSESSPDLTMPHIPTYMAHFNIISVVCLSSNGIETTVCCRHVSVVQTFKYISSLQSR